MDDAPYIVLAHREKPTLIAEDVKLMNTAGMMIPTVSLNELPV